MVPGRDGTACRDNRILAGLFSLIETVIRPLYQLLQVGGIIGECRHTKRCRKVAAGLIFLLREIGTGYGLAQRLTHLDSPGLIAVGQYDYELLATETCRKVTPAYIVFEQRGHFPQHEITGLVPL